MERRSSRGNAPVLPESMLPLLLDLRYPLHRLHRRLDQLAVVPDGDVSPLLELNRGILGMFGWEEDCVGDEEVRTMVISFPAALRNAFVQRTFLGFRFILRARYRSDVSSPWKKGVCRT